MLQLFTRRAIPLSVAGVLLLAAAGGVGTSTSRAAPPAADTASVSRGTVTQVLPLAGNVATRSQASVAYAGRDTIVTEVDAATGQVVTAGTTLARMANGATLTAPLTGTVVAVGLQSGALVPSSSTGAASPSAGSGGSGAQGGGGARQTQTISATEASNAITVADTRNLDVVASVSETNVHLLKVGQSVRLVIPGEPGIIYSGNVTGVAYTSVQGTSAGVTYPVTISLVPPKGAPLPWLGMSVLAYVTVATEAGIVVPVAALREDASGRYLVSLADGSERVVALGIAGIDQVIISAGLTAGTTIRIPHDSQPAKTVTVMP